MPKANQKNSIDLSESSVYGHDENETPQSTSGDTATEDALDRLETVTGGADEPILFEGELGRQSDALFATTAEELDALEVNLTQENDRPARDGSGYVVDDIAEQRLAGLTEVGPDLAGRGAVSVAPGNDNTSAVLRNHNPKTALNEVSRTESILEGNDDQPSDETRSNPRTS